MSRLLDTVALCLAVAAVITRTLVPSEDAFSGSGIPFLILEILPLPLLGLARLSKGARRRWDSAYFAWPAFLAWLAVSATQASGEFSAEVLAWEWVGAASIWLTFRLASGASGLRGAAILVAALTIANAVVALWQTSVAMPAMQQQFERRDPAFVRQMAEMGFAPGSPEEARFRDRLFSKEPYGTFGHPNSLAGLLVLGGSIIVGGAVGSRAIGRWLVGIPAALLVGFALILSRSRSAWGACIAAAAGILGRASITRHWKVIAAGGVLIALVVVGLAAAGLFDRFIVTEAPKSMSYRLEWWRASWDVLCESPIFGVGWGSFGSHYLRYKLPFSSEEIRDPHNFILELACSAGLPALVGYLWIVGASLYKMTKSSGDFPEDSPLPLGYWIGPILGAAYLLSTNGSDAVFIALVGMAVALPAFMLGWSGEGQRLDDALRRSAVAGVVGLHIHWLAAGGVGYPGLLLPLFAILGAGNASEETKRPGSLVAGIVLSAAGLSLLTVFLTTLFIPWTTAEQEASRARIGSGGSLRTAAERLPRDPHRWVQLASWRAAEMGQRKGEAALMDYQAAVHAVQQSIALENRSSAHFWLLGQIHEQAANSGLSDSGLQEAAKAYRAACERYPNSAARRFRYGEVLGSLGRNEEAKAEYKRSLELDETPHPDKKLSAAQRETAKQFLSKVTSDGSRP